MTKLIICKIGDKLVEVPEEFLNFFKKDVEKSDDFHCSGGTSCTCGSQSEEKFEMFYSDYSKNLEPVYEICLKFSQKEMDLIKKVVANQSSTDYSPEEFEFLERIFVLLDKMENCKICTNPGRKYELPNL